MTIQWAYLGEGVRIYDPHLSIFLRPEMIRIGDRSRLDGDIKIEGGLGVHIGTGCHISTEAHLNIGGGKLTIGNNVAVAAGAKIISGTNTLDGRSGSSAAPPEMQVIIRGEVVIHDFAFIGVGVIVQPGVHIHRYGWIYPGAVVTKDVPPYAIMAGIPARQIGYRPEREGWHWGDGDTEAPPLPDPLAVEVAIVKKGIADKYGFEPSDRYAEEFVSFIESMIKL